MKGSYGEGLATHTDPESCGAACEGWRRSVDRGTCGSGIQTRKDITPGCRRCKGSGRLHPAPRYRERRRDPARSETPCTYGDTSHENREIRWLPATVVAAGRVGKSKDARRR